MNSKLKDKMFGSGTKDIPNFKEEIEDLKKKEEELCDSVSSCKQVIDIERQQLSYMGLHSRQFHEILTSNASIKNDTHDIKQGQGKHSMVIMAIVFLSGLAIGTQYKVWTPFVNGMYQAFKTAKEITK